MGSSPVGVQCTFDYYFPCVSVLCLPFQNVYFLITPFLYIVQPFPFWSSSFCFSFHLLEHHLLYQLGLQILKKLPGRPPRFWTGTRPEIRIIFSISISKQGYLTIKHTPCLTIEAIHKLSNNIHTDILCIKIYLKRPNWLVIANRYDRHDSIGQWLHPKFTRFLNSNESTGVCMQ